MSLFQCSECGCCENTALCNYHWSVGYLKQVAQCSACDPEIGKWHGKFQRTFLPKGEWVTNQRGDLAHHKTGATDFQKHAIKPEDPTHGE